MSKKKKINKKKFISRIVMLLLILIIITCTFKVIFKKDNTNIFEQCLIVDNKDITESLIKDIYIDKGKNLYISVEDIKNIFDKNLYIEEETEKIITTSDTKVAAIDINNDTLELNSATLKLSSGVLKIDKDYYIPVSEIKNIYNIELTTTENTAIISSLYKELITVKTTKKVSLKEETSAFSKTIQKLKQGEEVIFLGESEKTGWIKILTYEGKFGYIKEKKSSNKEYKRTNMEESDFTAKTADTENSIEINKKTITTENLKDFSTRKKTVEDIISKAISKEKYTIKLNLQDVEIEERLLQRFILELIPRLREIGGSVVITNNNILSSIFIDKNNL